MSVGLECEADVGPADLVGAFVAFGHASSMVWHAHFQRGYAEAGDPFAEAVLSVPFGVPVGKDENSRAFLGFNGWTPVSGSGPEACVDDIVFRPGRDSIEPRESKDVLFIEVVISGWRSGEPFCAVFDRVFGVIVDKIAGVRVTGITTDVFQAPFERLDATIVVRGPAAVLVAANFAFGTQCMRKVGC